MYLFWVVYCPQQLDLSSVEDALDVVSRELELFGEPLVSDPVYQPPAQYLSVALGVFAADELGDHFVDFRVTYLQKVGKMFHKKHPFKQNI